LSEQEGDFDPDTRFALAWFRQHGFDSGEFGDADNLARARNASLEHLERAGILTLRGTRGKVTLLAPENLDEEWDPASDTSISAWEVVMHLGRTLTDRGVIAASAILTRVPESIDRDLCKELAFLLFALAEDAKRTKVAVEFNALGTAWNDIVAGVGPSAEQGTFDYSGEG
jgi:putative DNA methylase